MWAAEGTVEDRLSEWTWMQLCAFRDSDIDAEKKKIRRMEEGRKDGREGGERKRREGGAMKTERQNTAEEGRETRKEQCV